MPQVKHHQPPGSEGLPHAMLMPRKMCARPLTLAAAAQEMKDRSSLAMEQQDMIAKALKKLSKLEQQFQFAPSVPSPSAKVRIQTVLACEVCS
jgi:hypothetical protein